MVSFLSGVGQCFTEKVSKLIGLVSNLPGLVSNLAKVPSCLIKGGQNTTGEG